MLEFSGREQAQDRWEEIMRSVKKRRLLHFAEKGAGQHAGSSAFNGRWLEGIGRLLKSFDVAWRRRALG